MTNYWLHQHPAVGRRLQHALKQYRVGNVSYVDGFLKTCKLVIIIHRQGATLAKRKILGTVQRSREGRMYHVEPWWPSLGGPGRKWFSSTKTVGGSTPAFSAYTFAAELTIDRTESRSSSRHRSCTADSFNLNKPCHKNLTSVKNWQ